MKLLLFFLIFEWIAIDSFLPVQAALGAENPWTVNRDDVGLNVHWSLGGFGNDDLYERILQKSGTSWVREHFYTELLVYAADPSVWFDRYDAVMEKYKSQGVNVVGMLAYGSTHGDFRAPRPEEWEVFVRKVVRRYKRYVRVWEVWNEPDSPDYLSPNTVETFGPILEQAYRIIKENQPGALVLNGGLASPNAAFAEELYRDYGSSFDALAFHVYTCRDRDLGPLNEQLKKLKEVKDRYGDRDQAWVTEYGCSRGTPGMTEEDQRNYTRDAASVMIETGWIRRVFVFNIMDMVSGDPYIDEFGLWSRQREPYLVWDWYRKVAVGPYGVRRISQQREKRRLAFLHERLKHHFPKGIPTVSSQEWDLLHQAYLYGEYPIPAIVQSLRYGMGKTVHARIGHEQWQKTSVYKKVLGRDF